MPATFAAIDGEISGSLDDLEFARRRDRSLLSADLDVGTILARTSATALVIIFRCTTGRRPHEQAALLLAKLRTIAEALDGGSIRHRGGRVRMRTLPISE